MSRYAIQSSGACCCRSVLDFWWPWFSFGSLVRHRTVSRIDPKIYSFEAFIERVKPLQYEEMLVEAQKACAHAEAVSFGRKGCVAHREAGSCRFAADLKAFIFFMSHFAVPRGHEGDLLLYRPIVEKLVESGKFKKDTLSRFDALLNSSQSAFGG
jgi:hypothetical protein